MVWRWVATTAFCLLQVTPCLPRATTATASLAVQVKTEQQKRTLVPPQACQGFSDQQDMAASEHGTVKNRSNRAASASPPSSPSPSSALGSYWSASDCMDVWASWTATLPASLQPSYANRELLQERGADMRARGVMAQDGSITHALNGLPKTKNGRPGLRRRCSRWLPCKGREPPAVLCPKGLVV